MNEPPTETAVFAVSSDSEIALVSSMYWKLKMLSRARGARKVARRWDGRRSRRAARRRATPSAGDDGLARVVDRSTRVLKPQVDRVLLVPRDVANDDLRLGHLFAQQRRQRDPVVERVRLVGEHRDRRRQRRTSATVRRRSSLQTRSQRSHSAAATVTPSHESPPGWFKGPEVAPKTAVDRSPGSSSWERTRAERVLL